MSEKRLLGFLHRESKRLKKEKLIKLIEAGVGKVNSLLQPNAYFTPTKKSFGDFLANKGVDSAKDTFPFFGNQDKLTVCGF